MLHLRHQTIGHRRPHAPVAVIARYGELPRMLITMLQSNDGMRWRVFVSLRYGADPPARVCARGDTVGRFSCNSYAHGRKGPDSVLTVHTLWRARCNSIKQDETLPGKVSREKEPQTRICGECCTLTMQVLLGHAV